MIVRKLFAEPDGGRGLDVPVGELNNWNGAIPVRAYLTHHTGLANPDDTPADKSGVPAFYRPAQPDLAYCSSKPTKPGAPFSYNNCDYLKIARVTGPILWPAGMAMARRGEKGVPGYVGGKPEPDFTIATWGEAGGLMGTATAVFAFDRALMTGKLLPPAALKALWTPEGNGSYQALGQWVFPGKLRGCAASKRIVQRDGEIYGVQARNFILPDDDLVVIVFTNRSSDDFKFGEVWEGKGFVYDLLSAVACS
jgi:CubicO group peptidase (beta-lactamase class C family)